jgi:hypothetical protein
MSSGSSNGIPDIRNVDILNVILVGAGVRPACLLERSEPADISHILARYPELRISRLPFGSLVGKRSYTAADVGSEETLGAILGYPCAADFEELEAQPDQDRTLMELIAVFNSGDRLQIYANICKDTAQLPTMHALAAAAETALRADPLFASEIRQVYVAHKTMLSPLTLIQKVQSNKPIRDEDRFDLSWNIRNTLWNAGFQRLEFEDFNVESAFHRGVLTGLLTYCENSGNVLDWENSIIRQLRAVVPTGGRRGTRRQKQRQRQRS